MPEVEPIIFPIVPAVASKSLAPVLPFTFNTALSSSKIMKSVESSCISFVSSSSCMNIFDAVQEITFAVATLLSELSV